jgi:hypothetical protein
MSFPSRPQETLPAKERNPCRPSPLSTTQRRIFRGIFDEREKSGVYCKASLTTVVALAGQIKAKKMSELQSDAMSKKKIFLTEAKKLM